jgi:2-polyprenyl-6-methoxyphenol hydroxylase-like FAD-dependent oxidoreductase
LALLVAPLGDGVHHRVVVDAPVAVAPSEPVSLIELAATAARIAGTNFLPRDPIWLSRFTDETRLAEHYRKGRILLAGDAAHIHAMGGQGLNVGIHDAMNLGWKLAGVLCGTASEALLDTYERERWPVGDALRRNTLAQVALFCTFGPSALALRGAFEDILHVREVKPPTRRGFRLWRRLSGAALPAGSRLEASEWS